VSRASPTPHRGPGWYFGYIPLSDWGTGLRLSWKGWGYWLFYHNSFYHARGLRCTYTRICGVEIEHIYPY
jgi:hypothetical protein